VDFEAFRPDLEKALAYSDGSKGGRPPFDPVQMFKILVIRTLNNLSDERTEYVINDRLSFMRFLGLGLSDRVPDAKTVWLFRERLPRAGAIDILLNRFNAVLRRAIPMRRKRICVKGVFLKTGRTNRQSCPTRTAMHSGP